MNGCLAHHIQCDGTEPLTGIVDGVDPNGSGVIRVVDDPNEALLHTIGSRHEQRQGVFGTRLRLRMHRVPCKQ